MTTFAALRKSLSQKSTNNGQVPPLSGGPQRPTHLRVQPCPSCNAMKGTKTPPGTRPIRHASVRDVPPPVARSKRVIKRLVPLAPAAAQASRCRQKHTERTDRTRAAEGIHTAPAAEPTAAPQQNRAHGPLTRLQAQFAAVLNGDGDARQFMVEALTSGSLLGGGRRGGGR